MAKLSPEVLAHLEWLGFVQPTGLVVSASALVAAGVHVQQRDPESQRLLLALVEERRTSSEAEPEPYLPDFQCFARSFLDWRWSPSGFAGGDAGEIPPELIVHLPDYEETLAPDFAVAERTPDEGASPWQLLVRELEIGQDLDHPVRGNGQLEASPHARLERLLRQTNVHAGLLFNGYVIRLVSAPRGESSGWIDFNVADMVQTAGRPICAALRLLLSEQRLLAAGKSKRLSALLESSRKYQNTVSERLAEQVLHGLYELMRGLQSAQDASKGDLLRNVLADDQDEVYRALLNVVLRLVFLLYAEERGMLPGDETFVRHYSLAGLFERLREDAALHPDTMDQRYGAWGQLLVVFRMLYDGAECGELKLPSRHGVLFDPSRYPFLEGRRGADMPQGHMSLDVPKIPDGTIYRCLEKLLILDGERISYRALDVEQIGSVYETMMGFRIEKAVGTSVAIKAQKKHGAPTTISLDSLKEVAPKGRAKWIQDRADRKLTKTVTDPLKQAETIEDLHHALDKVIDRRATPDLVPRDALVLQPSEARRKSGSHYTPRALTEPIVRTTLRPILERLREESGGPPTPEQILDLKVCDPAMGSGAFLVEACRQLGDALIEAWSAHNRRPAIPADEDEVVHARRLVAQRCLYGVDRNPVAVDLAKVSLWLATLAREHAFTFVDHALRHGDSLVGLTNAQIAARDWSAEAPLDSPRYRQLQGEVERVGVLRRQIREAADEVSDFELRDLLEEAEQVATKLRTYGDLLIEAFFAGSKDKQRRNALEAASALIAAGEVASERLRLDERRREDPPLAPFHWELEYPEVFEEAAFGFDAIVGNPPFLGGRKISTHNGISYFNWIKGQFIPAGNTCDLVGYFFRRAFDLMRAPGCLGLIATQTIADGATREGALEEIRRRKGVIYSATKRLPWPGSAAVIVSLIHISKGLSHLRIVLSGKLVESISAFLLPGHVDVSPTRLVANKGLCSLGSYIYGPGFLFDDENSDAGSLDEMAALVRSAPATKDRILPYIGGQDVNESPTHASKRFVIFLSDLTNEDELACFPELEGIVRRRVKPLRDQLGPNPVNDPLKRRWWAYQAHRPSLYEQLDAMERVLVACRVSRVLAPAFLETGAVYSDSLVVFVVDQWSGYAVLASGLHAVWASLLSGQMGDAMRYTPSDCFETFPFPEGWRCDAELEAAGSACYEYRAQLLIETKLGLTKTYNRFHDPDERSPEIVRLRELHSAMDRAVLDAYGWSDISTDCEFLLDYEDEGDEAASSRRKKPWRYRWPDTVRDKVLARLLELNAQRAAAEARDSGTGELFA